MKAYVWTNPGEFQERVIPQPEITKGNVLIRVHYAGICGSDLSGYLGENSLRKPPLIMGHELTGSIVETGADVSSIKPGDIVTVNPLISCGKCNHCLRGTPQYCPSREIVGIHRPGGYAELISVPASCCVPTGDEKMGSLTEPLACSVRAVRQANIGLGDNVIVFGAGIIGLFSAWLAHRSGAERVIVVDTNANRLKLANMFGATDCVNASAGRTTEHVLERCQGSVDRVIDAVGLDVTRTQSIEMVRPGGNVVWIGLHEENSMIPANLVVRKEVSISGSFCYDNDDFHTAHRILEQEQIAFDQSWVTIRPMSTIKACFDEQIDGPATHPKILLSLRD